MRLLLEQIMTRLMTKEKEGTVMKTMMAMSMPIPRRIGTRRGKEVSRVDRHGDDRVQSGYTPLSWGRYWHWETQRRRGASCMSTWHVWRIRLKRPLPLPGRTATGPEQVAGCDGQQRARGRSGLRLYMPTPRNRLCRRIRPDQRRTNGSSACKRRYTSTIARISIPHLALPPVLSLPDR